ncbi:unnamed protein product [Clavelina lepadiformis]|uniref:Uncharacterized protein n=1 Tax=Clavelina lepadiformis TaxID=159417 RepID=A0ABP0FX51_CLALP
MKSFALLLLVVVLLSYVGVLPNASARTKVCPTKFCSKNSQGRFVRDCQQLTGIWKDLCNYYQSTLCRKHCNGGSYFSG